MVRYDTGNVRKRLKAPSLLSMIMLPDNGITIKNMAKMVKPGTLF